MQRVLVITYYWPPAGGPGVQRWLKFVKYLPDFEVDPIVFVPENPTYPIFDEGLVKEIPDGVKVIKHAIREPYGWAGLLSKKKTKTISSGIIREKDPSTLEKVLLWVRGNLFIPDARKFWVKPSIKYLSRVIQKQNIDTIITTGPPHSVHLIGMGLKKKFPIQWVVDFRDPWTSIGYHSKLRLSNWAQQKHKSLECQVLNGADKIVVTSNTTKMEFAAITSKPIKVITNGFEEALQKVELDQKFTISHIGSLLTGRNPHKLWEVLKELTDTNENFRNQLEIQLIGVVGEEVLSDIDTLGLSPFVKQLGYVAHDKVLKTQQRSQILLLLEIDAEETKGIIPGKLFEYLSAKRPILAMGPDGWEAGKIINDTNSGQVLTQKDASALKDVLLTWFNSYLEGKLDCNSTGIGQYHRKELTKSLANYIQWESS